jgi:CDP-diacylglycerol--serine O-phosphatidyltransferase
VIYLLSLPLGWKSYRDQQRDFVSRSEAATTEAGTPSSTEGFPAADIHSNHNDRPTHLN